MATPVDIQDRKEGFGSLNGIDSGHSGGSGRKNRSAIPHRPAMLEIDAIAGSRLKFTTSWNR